MPSNSNFDRDIKGVPQMGTSVGIGGIVRRLTLSSSANESGVNSARSNIKGHQ